MEEKKGTLYLNSFYESKSNPDLYRISIARGNYSKIAVVNETLSSLAPSKELFSYAQTVKKKPYHNYFNWFDVYTESYKKQLAEDNKAIEELYHIKELLDSGKDVEILCFCRSYKRCHRRIVGDMFKKFKYDVIFN